MKKNLLFAAVLLSGCLSIVFAGGNAAQPGTAPTGVQGPVKLSIAVPDNPKIENYKTTVMGQMLEKEANVDLGFVVYPKTDYVNKINIMIMAGGKDLQDVIMFGESDMSNRDSQVYQWAQTGTIVPVTKYFNDPALSPNLHQARDRIKVDYFPLITAPDGEIYYVPNFNQSYINDYRFKFYYYKPWIDKLGLKTPQTTDELKTLLRAIVNADPNGNKMKDEIGLSGNFKFDATGGPAWFRYLMGSFTNVGDLTNLQVVNNGKVSVSYNTNEWKEGLKYIRSLFAEGLIPLETLTQDSTQLRTLLNLRETRLFSFVDSANYILESAIGANYECLLPMKGPKGFQSSPYSPGIPKPAYLVTANCKNIDAAFKLGDLMVREDYSIITRFGSEGKDWDYPKNVANASSYVPMIPNWPLSIIIYDDVHFWGSPDRIDGSFLQIGPFIRQYGIANGMGTTVEQYKGADGIRGTSAYLYQESGLKPKEFITKLIYTQEEIDEVSEIYNNLLNYLTETTSGFLSGIKDIDSSWNAYLTELENMGLSRAIRIAQNAYDRMYKK
jgi:putative aldouronate transport system substrate-binding protein